jgi:hypothetical protein
MLLLVVCRLLPPNHLIPAENFFFWWGLLHGPQQGPDRMKEKTYKTGKRKTPASTEKPSLKNHSLRNWPTLARAQAESMSEDRQKKA